MRIGVGGTISGPEEGTTGGAEHGDQPVIVVAAAGTTLRSGRV